MMLQFRFFSIAMIQMCNVCGLCSVAGVRVRGWRIRGVVAVELLAARLVIPQEPKIKTR